jgi:2,4-dienoyl-CoA reductase-like NADH-dependent reductase (Old Yellow Enzyme family)
MFDMPNLLDPIQLGDLHLPNRVFMAPLTRLRGTTTHIPTPIMADYYAQRASSGLIISEGTPIDPMGVGYANVPGLWSAEQTEAWKPPPFTTQAVTSSRRSGTSAASPTPPSSTVGSPSRPQPSPPPAP